MTTQQFGEFMVMDPHELAPNVKNPRKHPQKQRHALHESLEQLGWIKPLIWNKRTERLIDGHARREEAIEEGIMEVPVFIVDLDESQELAAIAALDRITTMAKYDEDMFQDLLSNLTEEHAQLSSLLSDFSLSASSDEDGEQSGESGADSADEEYYPRRIQLVPNEKFNYVMLLFRTEIDWLHAIEYFDIKERLQDPFRTSKSIGQVRVIDGIKYLDSKRS